MMNPNTWPYTMSTIIPVKKARRSLLFEGTAMAQYTIIKNIHSGA